MIGYRAHRAAVSCAAWMRQYRTPRIGANGQALSNQTGRRIKYLGVWKGDTVKRSFTAVIEHEGDGYVALCPELDIASQGSPIEEARTNLVEAVELFLETASAAEIDERLHEEV